LAKGNWQKAIGKRQLAKGNWQKAIGKRQLARGNLQIVGYNSNGVFFKRSFKYILLFWKL
jgi:hypothetical protein